MPPAQAFQPSAQTERQKAKSLTAFNVRADYLKTLADWKK